MLGRAEQTRRPRRVAPVLGALGVTILMVLALVVWLRPCDGERDPRIEETSEAAQVPSSENTTAAAGGEVDDSEPAPTPTGEDDTPPDHAEVPDVTGMPLPEAVATLWGEGFHEAGWEEVDAAESEGTCLVERQNPPGGEGTVHAFGSDVVLWYWEDGEGCGMDDY